MTRARIALIAAPLVIMALGAAVLVLGDRDSRLDKAIKHLDDEKRFTTSAKAGQTVADISTTLRRDGTECREKNTNPRRCDAVLSAAAFTAVTAVTMLDCTAPDVHDARIALGRYLRTVRAYVDGGAQGNTPTIPKIITC